MSQLDPEQTICFCHNVPYKTLLEAIRGGATTLQAIKETTCASTGCGGCETEVAEILEAELAQGTQSAQSAKTGQSAS